MDDKKPRGRTQRAAAEAVRQLRPDRLPRGHEHRVGSRVDDEREPGRVTGLASALTRAGRGEADRGGERASRDSLPARPYPPESMITS